MSKRWITITFMVVASRFLWGQSCQENLEDARRAYYNGNLRNVIALLEPCMLGELLDKRDQESGLKLMINSLLILNEDSLADQYMKALLQANPLLESQSNDLAQYQDLHATYEIAKRKNIGLIAGINRASFTTLQYRSLGSIAEEGDEYETKPRVSFGIDYDHYFLRNMFISTGVTYNTYSYKQRELLLTYQQSFIEERLDYLTIPIQLGVEFSRNKMDVFASGGLAANVLLSSHADLELFGVESENDITINPGIPEKEEQIDLRFQRRNVALSGLINVGIRRRFGLIGLEVAAQYEIGLNNLVNESGRFQKEEVWRKFSYVSNDFKMDAFKVFFGVSKRFSTPKKRGQ